MAARENCSIPRPSVAVTTNSLNFFAAFLLPAKLSLQFPPGVLSVVHRWRGTSAPILLEANSRLLRLLHHGNTHSLHRGTGRISVLSRMHVHQPSRCCCAARSVEYFHLWIMMSELSGYESASPLVALRNVFPSRCDHLYISWQLFAHVKDSECFHRASSFFLPAAMALTISSLTLLCSHPSRRRLPLKIRTGSLLHQTVVNPATCKNLPPCPSSSGSSAMRASRLTPELTGCPPVLSACSIGLLELELEGFRRWLCCHEHSHLRSPLVWMAMTSVRSRCLLREELG